MFWGGREGYQSLLNTDVKRELDHMAAFFRMVIGEGRRHFNCPPYCCCFLAAYKHQIGFTGQLLIEPKPKEPMKHQYDYGVPHHCLLVSLLSAVPPLPLTDAQTVISFLKSYGLDKEFKVC